MKNQTIQRTKIEFAEGMVELIRKKNTEELNPIFLYNTALTQPMDKIKEICAGIHFAENASTHEKIFRISEEINKQLQYTSGVTSVRTSAEEALLQGKGVCQDFAHTMLAMCRIFGIAARYVSGFMEGEGYTHAWIEYYHLGSWFGFDPTHNRPADPGYIKLSHGRDYNDCAIDKGHMPG
jgi:transglutaminase/protease-like cytokinesis protein 3